MLIAENELLGAAESIEKAAKKLASLKPRREVRGKVGTVVNPSPPPALCYPYPELGTLQHCRDNVTMFSGHTIAGSCIVSMFVVASPFIHRNLKNFRIFSCR